MDTYNSKKEPLSAQDVSVTLPPKLIRVIAPTNLPGGYQLEVQTDNDPPYTFTTTVPPGGVNAGDIFLTPPPAGYSPPVPQIDAPIGRWRDGLFDCCNDGLFNPLLCMSFILTEITIGQIMQRFRLTWLGGLTPSFIRVKTFRIVVILYVCFRIYDWSLQEYLIANYGRRVKPEDKDTRYIVVSYLKDVVSLSFSIWAVYALYKTRKHVRKTYSIPEQHCTGYEDCLLSCFCSCCTVAQIGRHTADPKEYPSYCCTETGLSDDAPVVV